MQWEAQVLHQIVRSQVRISQSVVTATEPLYGSRYPYHRRPAYLVSQYRQAGISLEGSDKASLNTSFL